MSSLRHPIQPGFLVAILIACAALTSCQTTPVYYSVDDFYQLEKIDAHVHLNSEDPALVRQALEDNFKLLTINVDYPDFRPVDQQLTVALALLDMYPKTVHFAASFSMTGWEEPGRIDSIVLELKQARTLGAVAVKVWKSIGMDVRDAKGDLLMVDDPRLDPIFAYLEDSGFPLIGHQGEPHNCWLPLDQMTVSNDREYFAEHPNYHMFLHPEMPSYEDQMSARDRRLLRNPKLIFDGAHLASLEWNVDELAAFLDRFPRASVDMAARMGQLQYQSKRDIDRVRNFLIKYQDRIMYATDLTQDGPDANGELAKEAHTRWLADWLYLSSADVITVPEVDGEFSGLKLPRSVIDKIYHSNAKAFFKAACSNNPTDKGCTL